MVISPVLHLYMLLQYLMIHINFLLTLDVKSFLTHFHFEMLPSPSGRVTGQLKPIPEATEVFSTASENLLLYL